MSKIWKWLLLIAGIFAVFVGFNMFAHPLISLASMTFWFALDGQRRQRPQKIGVQ